MGDGHGGDGWAMGTRKGVLREGKRGWWGGREQGARLDADKRSENIAG